MMGPLAKLEGIYRDLVVIGVELAIVVVAFLAVGLVLRVVLGRLESFPALQKFRERIRNLRHLSRTLLIIIGLLLLVVIAAFNGYLIFRRVDVYTYTQGWIDRIPPGFWLRTSLHLLAIVVVAGVARTVVRAIHKLLLGLQVRAKVWKQIQANDESIEVFFTALNRIQKYTIALLVLIFVVWLLALPNPALPWATTLLSIYLTIAIGLLLADAVAAIVDSLDALSRKYANTESQLVYYTKLRELIPLLRSCLAYVIYVLVASVVVGQLDFTASLAEYGPRVAKSIGIFFLARVLVALVNLFVDRSMARDTGRTEDYSQRRRTIAPIVKSLCSYVVFFGAFVLILRAMNFDPMPIVAGAGLVGLVLGLGAQPLINDMVSGFFILFEGIYLVGDYIETGTARGTVEAIEIRTTRIRNPDGQLHILRNGQLGEIVNFSKDYGFAVVQVGVSYDSNLDHVYAVLERTGADYAQGNPEVLEPMQVQGLEAFGESELTIRTLTRVKPGRHAQVARDLRKRIKDAFDREHIEIPFAQRVVIFKNDPPGKKSE